MKTDWTITGSGSISIIEHTGSKRLQILGEKLVLWNGNDHLINSEIIVDTRAVDPWKRFGGLALRSNSNGLNMYKLYMTNGSFTIYRVVNGVATALSMFSPIASYLTWRKLRFRIDDWQLSVEEYSGDNWVLLSAIEDQTQAHSSGSIGFVGIVSSMSGWLYDNVEIGEKV